MKKRQQTILVVIILLPVLIGIILLFTNKSDNSFSFSAGSFKQIGVVQIRGELMDATEYIRQLRTMRLDNNIAGVLVRVDSPGGAVAPAQEIYTEITRFREQKKPLVVSMGTVAASGGYYIASPAKKIFASPGTITGSIGVIFTVPMFQELSKKVGVDFKVFKAGKYKDIGSPYRKNTDDESGIIQDLLDDTHGQFIADVAAGRKMSRDSVRALADGRIFTGQQALKYRLIDTLGGYEDALAYVREITGVSARSKVISKKPRISILRDIIAEEASRFIPFISRSRSAGLYYLFDPSNFKF